MCHFEVPARSLTCGCPWVQRQPPTHSTSIAAQACIFSHLRGLTSLEIYHIGTPFQPASLDNTLACLPALEAVTLDFRKANSPAAPTGLHAPTPLLAFPCSLLR
jgi:hypothetical protein